VTVSMCSIIVFNHTHASHIQEIRILKPYYLHIIQIPT